MPAVPVWSASSDSPQFDLTNPYGGTLSFNVAVAQGLFLLDQSGCSFNIEVRSTKSDVPQSNGSILHPRFLTGTEMQLTIQLWENSGQVACGAVLADMLDTLSGSFVSLLNAGDNEGRLAWEVPGGNIRMLDDVRLLVYPEFSMQGATPVVTVTIDSQFPYAQDLTQIRTTFEDGVPQDITNTGTSDYWPVMLVNMNNTVVGSNAVTDFTITNLTTGLQFDYSDGLPGAIPIAANHYAEINTFRNTIFKDGDDANLSAGIRELDSDYWPLITGEQTIMIEGCDMDVLWAPAWA